MDRARLRWLCRRGTKELDVILNRYLDSAFDHADASEQQAFLALLTWEDPVLQERLLQVDGLETLLREIMSHQSV